MANSELPERFAGDEYRLLLVADKYQTGFDQPLLHTMYVDKKLSGVRAVQTLSRLNRTHPGKEDTFILDFANEPAEIQAAFQPFYEGTTIEEDIDPNQLYDLRAKLDAFAVTRPEEIEAFARAFFQPRGASSARTHADLNAAIDPAVARVRAKSGEEQAEYKHLLGVLPAPVQLPLPDHALCRCRPGKVLRLWPPPHHQTPRRGRFRAVPIE